MDPRRYAAKRFNDIKPELAWSPGTMQEMRAWQRRLHSRIRSLVGLDNAVRTPLKPRVQHAKSFSAYSRESVTFESRRGLAAFGYFLTPKGCPPHQPAVLCLPGHGRGVDSIVGIAENGSTRDIDAPDEYQADFALQCVSNGYPVFALEQISFGHRRDAQAKSGGPDVSSCTRDSMAALMMGETITGWRVWDAMRALDYMQTRIEVDPERIAVMGISGGGLTALWTACLDARVHTTVVSGYLNMFRDSILAVDHCVDNFVPGIMQVAEMPDLTGLIAPRHLFAENGARDSIFPVTAFKKACRHVKEIYAAFNVQDRFAYEIFDDEHKFHGVGAFKFLTESFGS